MEKKSSVDECVKEATGPPGKDLNPAKAAQPASNAGTPGRDEMLVAKVIIGFLKYAAVAFLIWLVGWFGFRYIWVVIGTVIYTIWSKNQDKKNEKKVIIKGVAENEEMALQARLDELPSWVIIFSYIYCFD